MLRLPRLFDLYLQAGTDDGEHHGQCDTKISKEVGTDAVEHLGPRGQLVGWAFIVWHVFSFC